MLNENNQLNIHFKIYKNYFYFNFNKKITISHQCFKNKSNIFRFPLHETIFAIINYNITHYRTYLRMYIFIFSL